VQASPSSQSIGVLTQLPLSQVSFVQASSSSQSALFWHWPLAAQVITSVPLPWTPLKPPMRTKYDVPIEALNVNLLRMAG